MAGRVDVTPDWSFRATTDYLENLPRRSLQPVREVGLRRIHFLLERLGNPERAFHVVHVAGSTGKGSTTTMIGAILMAAGLRTGYFRSPHLVSYRERIAIDELDVSEDDWIACFERVWPIAEVMASNGYPGYALGRPSHGEILLAMAALHFREAEVEWAAVEAGLGGRLDASNALPSHLQIITNISLEHTRILGSTIPQIAAEKAAIIKPGSTIVTDSHDPDALAVIADRAQATGARLVQVRDTVQARDLGFDLTGRSIVMVTGEEEIPVRLAGAGPFQIRNAATAAAAALALRDSEPRVTSAAVARGLETARVPGRFEVLGIDPIVILDGAHNPAGARELRKALDSILPDCELVLLFAAMEDKDISAMSQSLGPRASHVVVTPVPGSPRTSGVERLSEAFRAHSSVVEIVTETDRALQTALSRIPPGGALIVTGSLYLVGWARSHFGVGARL